jgi:prolyl oligopeptidase PreP (S9A serine peptidase family)
MRIPLKTLARESSSKLLILLFASIVPSLGLAGTLSSHLLCQSLFYPQANLSQIPALKSPTPDLKRPSAARDRWLSERAREVHQDLAQSPNTKGIGQWLHQVFDHPKVMKSEALDNDHTLKLLDRGLGKPTELVLVSDKGEEVLASNFSFKRNNTYRFSKFFLSPTKRYVILAAHENGSLDHFSLSVYDLTTRAFIRTGIASAVPAVVWTTSHEFIFNQQTSEKRSVAIAFDTKSPHRLKAAPWNYLYSGQGARALANDPSRGLLLATSGEPDRVVNLAGNQFNYQTSDSPAIGELGRAHLLATITPDGFYEISRIPHKREKTASAKAEAVVEVFTRLPRGAVIDDAYINKNYLFVESHLGLDRILWVYDHTGRTLVSIPAPDGCRFGKAKWVSEGERLEIPVSSAVKTEALEYDIATRRFLDGDVRARLLTRDGRTYRSEVVSTKSVDGTVIPIRLTYLEGLKRDGRNPVLLQAYGGFGLSGEFYPNFRHENLEFLKRGGILAGPALRGGNEFGRSWHEGAIGLNKEKTVDDLIASARALVSEGYTTPQKIISTGASNGGLIVAAAALKSPEAFGLVIAINGVLDLESHTELDRGTSGWLKEYGNAENDELRDGLQTFSPVARAAQVSTTPRMLFVNGRDDSRVNPAHSFLMKATLERNPKVDESRVRLYSVKNSGHWVATPHYQNVIGWRVKTVIWTTIFDYLSWRIDEAP